MLLFKETITGCSALHLRGVCSVCVFCQLSILVLRFLIKKKIRSFFFIDSLICDCFSKVLSVVFSCLLQKKKVASMYYRCVMLPLDMLTLFGK